MQTEKPLIFFDGLCHLCNAFVDKILQKDRDARFQFAPLQGETARKSLTPSEIADLASVILMEDGRKYVRSAAVLRILTSLGGFYRLWGLALVIPEFLRDGVYRWVAKNRYAWFGQKDVCRFPTPAEKDRLLP